MLNDLEPTQIAELISEVIQIDPKVDDQIYVFKLELDDIIKEITLCLSDLEPIIENIKKCERVDETGLYNGNCYEVLIRGESRFLFQPRGKLGKEGFLLVDKENGITYELSRPSDEYIIFLLNELTAIIPSWSHIRRYPLKYFLHRQSEYNNLDKLTLFDLVRHSLPNLLTLRITSEDDRIIKDFRSYADSFIFQYSYNLDQSLVPERNLEDLIRTSRISSHRRGHIQELDPPRRKYTRDLIHHYQLAVASESPPLEYLSLYHVIEHFFKSVFEDDLIDQVKHEITQPGFSYHRKTDIGKLIKIVRSSIRIQDQEVVFSEEEALRLTIKKFINISSIIQDLNEYDDKLIDHYRKNTVSFSKGVKVDLENPDEDTVFKDLAKRIYKTRNAIVHSKEGDLGKYIPFEHDKYLVKEIPLLRFLAERIIIKTSEIF